MMEKKYEGKFWFEDKYHTAVGCEHKRISQMGVTEKIGSYPSKFKLIGLDVCIDCGKIVKEMEITSWRVQDDSNKQDTKQVSEKISFPYWL